MTFLDAEYRTVQSTKQVTTYRSFGGNAKVGGTFVTTKAGAPKAELALLDEWNNSMRFEATINIPSGTKMNIGKVGAQTSTNGLQTLAGGGDQVILPGALQAKVRQKGTNICTTAFNVLIIKGMKV